MTAMYGLYCGKKSTLITVANHIAIL